MRSRFGLTNTNATEDPVCSTSFGLDAHNGKHTVRLLRVADNAGVPNANCTLHFAGFLCVRWLVFTLRVVS